MRSYVIASGSMEPEIPTGSVVFASPGDVSIGDVVVYASRAGVFQVHRIIEARETTDGIHYLLRGDANDAADSFLVKPEEIVGTVKTHVPWVGYLWLVPPGFQFALFSSALLGYLTIVWLESRKTSQAAARATTVLLVCLIAAPGVSAAITIQFPGSPPAADVLDTTPLPFSDGGFGVTTVSADENSATVALPTPKVWKEIVMWGCKHGIGGSTGCNLTDATTTPTAYDGSLTYVDTTTLPSATFRLEIYGRSSSASDTLTVDLYDEGAGAAVSGSSVVLSSGAPEWGVGSAFTLSGAEEYRFRYSASSGTSESLTMVKLVAAQGFPSSTETTLLASGAGETTSTTFAEPERSSRFTYDASGFDGTVAAYFEAVGSVTAGTFLPDGEVRLYDVTAGSAITSSLLSLTSSSVDRLRSGDISVDLTEGNTLRVDFRRSGGLLSPQFHLDLARLVIVQTGGFTETVRYVDLSMQNTTTSTSYDYQGFPSRYRMDTEWGNRTGYLDAKVRNTDGSGAAVLQLYDHAAGAAVAGSEVSDAADAWTYVRSSPFTLGQVNTTLQMQSKADSTGTTEVLYARLVVFQTEGKVFDAALVTTNSGSPACSWHLNASLASSSGLARLDSVVVTIREGATSEDQIVVTSGSVTTSSGSTVQVDGTKTLNYVVTYVPNATGSSQLVLSLLGDCGTSGVHTVLDITIDLD